MSERPSSDLPACRVDVTPEQLEREADRAVLYGACLLVVRPETRIKSHLQRAVHDLVPAVKAYYSGYDPGLAAQALRYAEQCGAHTFLDQKAALYRQRQSELPTDLDDD